MRPGDGGMRFLMCKPGLCSNEEEMGRLIGGKRLDKLVFGTVGWNTYWDGSISHISSKSAT
jgi:hypothetical protein